MKFFNILVFLILYSTFITTTDAYSKSYDKVEGEYTVKCSDYPSATKLTLTVNGHTDSIKCTPNRAPSVPIIKGNTLGSQNTLYKNTFHATDPDGDAIHFVLTAGKFPVSLNNKRNALQGMPQKDESNFYAIKACDTHKKCSKSVKVNYTINTNAAPTTPTLISGNPSQYIGSKMSLGFLSTDKEGDTITYETNSQAPVGTIFSQKNISAKKYFFPNSKNATNYLHDISSACKGNCPSLKKYLLSIKEFLEATSYADFSDFEKNQQLLQAIKNLEINLSKENKNILFDFEKRSELTVKNYNDKIAIIEGIVSKVQDGYINIRACDTKKACSDYRKLSYKISENPNKSPSKPIVNGERTKYHGEKIILTAKSTDPEGSAVTYKIVSSNLGSHIKINKDSGVITIDTSTLNKSYFFYVVASDGNTDSSATKVYVFIRNHKPTITGANSIQKYNQEKILYNFETHDGDNDNLSISYIGNLPQGTSFNLQGNKGTISGKANLVESGSFKIQVNDGRDITQKTVNYNIKNNRPTITSINGNTNIYEKDQIHLQINAKDIDNDNLEYYVNGGLPSGLNFNNNTGKLSGTTTQTGKFNLKFYVKDTHGASSKYYNFNLDIKPLCKYKTYITHYENGCKIAGDFDQDGKVECKIQSKNGIPSIEMIQHEVRAATCQADESIPSGTVIKELYTNSNNCNNVYANGIDTCELNISLIDSGSYSSPIIGYNLFENINNIKFDGVYTDQIHNSGQDALVINKAPKSNTEVIIKIASTVPYNKTNDITFDLKGLSTYKSIAIEQALEFKHIFTPNLTVDVSDLIDQPVLDMEQTYKIGLNKLATNLPTITNIKLDIAEDRLDFISENQMFKYFKDIDGNLGSINDQGKFTTTIISKDSAGPRGDPEFKTKDLPISYTIKGKNVKYKLLEAQIAGCDLRGKSVKVLGQKGVKGKFGEIGAKSISSITTRSQIRKKASVLSRGMNSNDIAGNTIYIENEDFIIPGNPANYDTVIIKNGNAIINTDIIKQLSIVVLKDNYDINSDYNTKGNVYIKNDVNNINAYIFADGAVRSADSNGNGYTKDLLNNPLKITGSLFTMNTINGALPDYNSGNYLLPNGNTTSNEALAKIYDLSFLRNKSDCSEDKFGTKITYNPEIKTKPPRVFQLD